MLKKLTNIHASQNRQRLIRFNMLKKQLCPICGNLVFFSNKDNAYVCRNEQCSFKEEKLKNNEQEQIKTNSI